MRRHGLASLRCDAPESEWRVVEYRQHRSAFGAYQPRPSRYSGVVCRRCGTYWRTCAAYVGRLQHAKAGDEWEAAE